LTPTERLEVGKVILELIQQDFQHLKPGPAMSEEEIDRLLEESSRVMLDSYLHDEELTIFTALDGEDFYD